MGWVVIGVSGVRYGVTAARRMHAQSELHHGVNAVVTGGEWVGGTDRRWGWWIEVSGVVIGVSRMG